MSKRSQFKEAEESRLALRTATHLKLILILSSIAGIFISFKLWLSERDFPLSPVWDALPTLSHPWDIGLVGCLIILLSSLIFSSNKYLFYATLGLSLLLVALDQSRLQPWFYQYVLMIGLLSFFYSNSDKSKSALDACRLALCGIYFWAGISKFNYAFVSDVFPWLFEPFYPLDGSSGVIQTIALSGPILEITIAICLLKPRFRKTGVILALGMHAFLLFLLGPLGHNYNTVIWPWNVAMALMVWVLFHESKISTYRILKPKSVAHGLAVLFFGILPALNHLGLWDHYLSFSLYSGSGSDAMVLVGKEDTNKDIDIFRWAMKELNVPPYPEERVFKSIMRAICKKNAPTTDMKLVIMGSPDPFTGVRTEKIFPGCSDSY